MSEPPTPTRWRKKPVEVEAVRLTPENGAAVWEWADSKPMYEGPSGVVTALRVYTIHGPVRAAFGDWIVRGPSGDFWPVDNAIFEESYEAVSGPRRRCAYCETLAVPGLRGRNNWPICVNHANEQVAALGHDCEAKSDV